VTSASRRTNTAHLYGGRSRTIARDAISARRVNRFSSDKHSHTRTLALTMIIPGRAILSRQIICGILSSKQ
jgi:hypothetical protein